MKYENESEGEIPQNKITLKGHYTFYGVFDQLRFHLHIALTPNLRVNTW